MGASVTGCPRRKREWEAAPHPSPGGGGGGGPGSVLSLPKALAARPLPTSLQPGPGSAFSKAHLIVRLPRLKPPGGHPLDTQVTSARLPSAHYVPGTEPPQTLACTAVQSSSHVRLCDPMDCSTPGFPVFDHFLKEGQASICLPSTCSGISPQLLCRPLIS